MRTCPFGLETGTIGAHHSVGLVTGLMISDATILSSSVFTASIIGNGTFLAVNRQKGSASGRSSILTGEVFMSPILFVTTSSSLATRPISVATSLDSKLFASSL